jgi:hypothetical protein
VARTGVSADPAATGPTSLLKPGNDALIIERGFNGSLAHTEAVL